MKIQAFLKIAVVATAALAAYAFSGSSLEENYYQLDGMCTPINVPCSAVGDELCIINIDGNQRQIWSDFGCTKVSHFNKL